MKIGIDINEQYSEIQVEVKAPALTQDVEKIVSMMRSMNMQIAVKKGDETVILDVQNILYIEAVERNTFVYTADETYETDLKLYEAETVFADLGFIRISKQSIVNIKKIKSLRAEINRKILVTLDNGERIVVSRMYSDELRRKLGVR